MQNIFFFSFMMPWDIEFFENFCGTTMTSTVFQFSNEQTILNEFIEKFAARFNQIFLFKCAQYVCVLSSMWKSTAYGSHQGIQKKKTKHFVALSELEICFFFVFTHSFSLSFSLYQFLSLIHLNKCVCYSFTLANVAVFVRSEC